MKKYVFYIFFFLFCTFYAKAQLSSVSLSCSTTGCQRVDPGQSYSYLATPIFGPNGKTSDQFIEYTYSITPSSAYSYLDDGSGKSENTTTTAIFNNINASNVNLTVSAQLYQRSTGVSTTVGSPVTGTLPITILYIGPIVSMTIGGSVVTGTSLNVPCGNQTYNVSVPTPLTSPTSGVVYSWSISGGTVNSQSGNTANVTTDVGTTDGTLIVKANRTDGSFKQGFVVNLIRPRVSNVTLSGNNSVLCPAGTTVQLNGSAANMTTWSWASTGGVTLTGANPSYPYKIASATSKGTVTFTADNACLSQLSSQPITIYGGAPTVETAIVSGHPNYSFNYINNPATVYIGTNEPGVTYTFQILQGTGSIYYPNQNSGEVNVYAYPFIRLEGRITNGCGSNATVFYLQNQSNGFYKMASPNPATSAVTAKINAPAALKSMSLVSNSQASVVRTYNTSAATDKDTKRDSDDNVSFDVSKLPRGKYFLNFVFEAGKNFTEQIMLE